MHKLPPRVIPLVPQGGRCLPRVESGPPPLSLYVHIPWCLRKCPYCDFNSHELRGALPEADYIAALIADLEQALPLVWGRRISSIFFGGGTPSLLSPVGLEQLISAIRARLPVHPEAEITLEANPGATEFDAFEGFRAAGINRLSIGVQSFNPTHLKALGRIHDDRAARRAIACATRVFDRVNLDLMVGLPGQTCEQARQDLETALAFGPTHLSAYQLTLEPNTAFAAAPPPLPDPDLCADMQDALENRLAVAGFLHYETSAFARPGHECRHNLNYWTFGDYLGLGAGAHSKLTLPDHILRQMRWKHPGRYLDQVRAGAPVQEENRVEDAALPFEFMMNALRLNQGFDSALFVRHTGLAFERIEAILQRAEQDGMISRTARHIAPTRLGQRFLNRLLERFL